MVFNKSVVSSFACAVMGFALTGAAYGQVAVPDISDGSIIKDGQIETDTVTEAPAPAADAAADAAADVKVNSTVDNTNSRGQTGIQADGTNNTNAFGARFDANTSDRLIIQELQPNSVATRLGLQAGDRIIELNGQTYTDGNQFNRDIAQLNANTEVPIIYERNGVRYTRNLRMSSQSGQQTYNGSATENPSYNAGPESHSAGRPTYDSPNYGGYPVANGNNSYPGGQACCGAPVYVDQCYGGHRHGRRHHHHRRCCR